MYTRFFGLSSIPFALSADPSFLLCTPRHREVLAGLTYAVMARKGMIVLTGEAGTGKTTLLTKVMQSMPSSVVQSSPILNLWLTPDEFLEMVLCAFGVGCTSQSRPQRILRFYQLLTDSSAQGKTSMLIIDEAHKLTSEVLEEIRLLSNFERAGEKLLQIVLAGQPELVGVLNRPELRQLKQRIALRLKTEPLSLQEVEQYVRHRWARAGGHTAIPFEPRALSVIAHWSQGIPRVINVICDNSLLLAFSEGKKTVTVNHVREACGDLDLIGSSAEEKAAAYANVHTGAGQQSIATRTADGPPAAERGAVAGTALRRRLGRDNGYPHKLSFVRRWAGRVGLIRSNGFYGQDIQRAE